MQRRDLGYDLPEHLIAQTPQARRDDARLLVAGEPLSHHKVGDLPELLPPSLIIFNNTRVIPARLLGQKPTGGKIEILLVEPVEVRSPSCARWHAMTKSSKPLRVGATVEFQCPHKSHAILAKVVERHGDGTATVELESNLELDTCIEAIGVPPLPPYIARDVAADDRERYQTVFASVPGAIAAPTAGLHFTPELLNQLRRSGHELAEITLHVGPGTFAPLREEVLADHPMHAERFSVSENTADAIARAKAAGRPVVAVGTTVVRTLEAAAQDSGTVKPGDHRTNLFIYPPYDFRVIDGLLTNFHLPYSTLLALVMARLGIEQTRQAYREAVAHSYRFFSYGDAMLIPPQPTV